MRDNQRSTRTPSPQLYLWDELQSEQSCQSDGELRVGRPQHCHHRLGTLRTVATGSAAITATAVTTGA